jgi:FkbM family methyltransferase
MGRAYARWLTEGTVDLPWGGSLSGFQRFSEFWSAWSNRPSSVECDFIARSLATGGIAFDVGANVGMFTRLLATAADGVHAFEPVPKTFTTLQHNVGGLPHVVLNQSALCEHDGQVQFQARGDSPAESRLAVDAATAAITVQAETLDSYCARHRIARIAFLKIDVEGGEVQVLRGASHMLSERRIDAMLLEIIPELLTRMGTNIEELGTILSQSGYSIGDDLGHSNFPVTHTSSRKIRFTA